MAVLPVKWPIKAECFIKKTKKKQCCAESWASRRNEYIPLEATAHLLIQCISLYTSLCLSNLCFSARKKKWKDCGRGTNAMFVFLSLFCSCVCFFLSLLFIYYCVFSSFHPSFLLRYWSPMWLCSGGSELSVVLNWIDSIHGAESPVWSL